jgi:hypothetical protein
MQALPAAMGRPQRQPPVAQASCAEKSSLLPKAIRTTCAFAGMTMRFSPCGYLTTILGSPAPADPVVPRPVSGKRRALPPRSNVARIRIHYGYGAKRARRGPFRTQIGLCRHSNPSLFAGRNSAGKEFGEARDWAGVFGDTRRFRGTETAPPSATTQSCANPGFLASSEQSLTFRGFAAGDVEAVLIGPVSVFFSPLTGKRTRNFVKIDSQA